MLYNSSMKKILFPKEDIVTSIQKATILLNKMRRNYIAFPKSIVQGKSEYENLKQCTNNLWLKEIKETIVEELNLIIKIDENKFFTKHEKMSLQAKCVRRLHECITKVLFLSERSSDERYLSFVLEYLYTLGKAYKYANSSTRRTLRKTYEEENVIHKELLTKYKIPTIPIYNSGQIKKCFSKDIPEGIQTISKYNILDKDGLQISKNKSLNKNTMYFKYIVLSEFTHAKGLYSKVIPNLSELLPLLFAHEISLIALELLSKHIYNSKTKEIEVWVEEYKILSVNYVKLWEISKAIT